VSPGIVTLLGVGANSSLSAALTPSSASGSITWRSDNVAVVTVSGSGPSATITAVGSGSTTVTATAGGVSGSTNVTVTPVVRSLTISPTVSVTVGQTVRPTVVIAADPGATQTLQYTSSATGIATVASDGTIAGVSPGTATVTIASLAFPNVTTTTTVTVSFPVVRSITITPANSLVFAGQTRTLTATLDVDAGTSTAVTWSSTPPAVATVSSAGVVTALLAGTATITATSVANPGVSGTTTVVISTPTVRSVTLPPSASIAQGRTQQITPTVNADPGANTALNWTTGDAAIASVNSGGLITANAPGVTTLRVQSVLVPAIEASMQITVTNAPTLASWLAASISPPNSRFNRDVSAAYGAPNGVWWASMDGAPLLRFDGAQWVASSITFPANVDAMSGRGSTLWVLLSNGRVWRTDNAQSVAPVFVEESVPGGASIETIQAVSSTQLVAASSTQVFVRDGLAWSTLAAPGITTIRSSAAASPSDIVVGSLGGSAPYLRRWNGTVWSDLPALPFAGNVQQLLMRSGELIVRATNNTQHFLSGSTWSSLTSPGSRAGLSESIVNVESCQGSDYAITVNGGRVYRRVANAWTVIADYGVALPGTATGRLRCGEDGVLRAFGSNGTIARLGNSDWVWEHQATRFMALSLVRPDLAYAAGSAGQIYRWNGTSWSLEVSDAVIGFQSISAVEGLVLAGTLDAAGAQSQGIYQRVGNGPWSRQATTGNCRAVWVASPAFALAAGVDCSQRWNGSAWIATTPLTGTIGMIDGLDANFAIAVGFNGLAGVAYQWNGSVWLPISTPAGVIFNYIQVHSSTLAYAIGNNTKLYQWNGTSFAEVTLPGGIASQQIQSVSVNNPSDVYILGHTGAVWRFDGQSWQEAYTITGLRSNAIDASSARPLIATIPGFGIVSSTWGGFFHAASTASAGGLRWTRRD
jgi:uncharacterized protein YjdB